MKRTFPAILSGRETQGRRREDAGGMPRTGGKAVERIIPDADSFQRKNALLPGCGPALVVRFSGSLFFNNQSFLKGSIMRIYYAKKGLRGKPYCSDIINADLFTFFRGKYRSPDAETLRAANAFTECGRDMDDNTDYE